MKENKVYEKFCLEVDDYFIKRGFKSRNKESLFYKHYAELKSGEIIIYYDFLREGKKGIPVVSDKNEKLIRKMVGFLNEVIKPFYEKHNISSYILLVSIGAGYRYLTNGDIA